MSYCFSAEGTKDCLDVFLSEMPLRRREVVNSAMIPNTF